MVKSNLKDMLFDSKLYELKIRILYLIVGILIFRFGVHIPVPGINISKLSYIFDENYSGLLGLFNMFSGGALQKFAVFALGIMPYISASIIMQLFSSVIPVLEQLKKEGESGQKKINSYTKILTLFLAMFQSLTISKMLIAQDIVIIGKLQFYFISMITLTAGTMFILWLGEKITEKGIGNGISILICAGIISGLPSAIARTYEQINQGQMSGLTFFLIILLVFLVVSIVVYVERSLRKISITYASRQQGNKIYASQKTSLPLKLNMAGVLPPIFATSMLLFPASIIEWFGGAKEIMWLTKLSFALQRGPIHIFLFVAGIIFFSFFYTSLMFNPKDTALNLKKSSAFIPGVRPGEQTEKYIGDIMKRLTVVGAIYMSLVCLVPQFMNYFWNVPFYFGGTSLLIIVVVIIDLIAQVQTHLLSHQYESLLKKNSIKGSNMGLFG